MRAKDVLGRRGEELASAYLEGQGMRILDRNWRCPEGEIDVVAIEGGTLVFAEVKTRSSLAYGHPFEAVGADKLARLHRLAANWCRHHGLTHPPRRVDVVAVLDDGIAEPTVEHLREVG